MVDGRNCLTFFFQLYFYKLSIVMLESTTIVHIFPEDKELLNCSESSFITIRNVSVQDIGKCESEQTECNLNSNDHDLIKECEGSASCYADGSLLTFACQWEDPHFNIPYICQLQVSYEYVGCFFDDDKRVLEEDHKNNQEMSADICFGKCTASQKWKENDYFGTEFAKECFCGNGTKLEIGPYVKYENSECKKDCLKHTGEKCGDDWKISVYRIIKRNYYYMYSCLGMDLENCFTYQIQDVKSCIKFDASLRNQLPRCSDFGNQLYDHCINEHVKCVFNMINMLRRSISIEYLCKENILASSSTLSSLPTGDGSKSSSALSSSDNLPTSTTHHNNVTGSRQTSENATGTVVGSVVGSVLFLCIVFLGIYIGRRFVFCAKSKEKLRNSPETNDYVGNQHIALPQAISPTRHGQYQNVHSKSGYKSTHNYSNTNIRLQNIDDKYDYSKNIETNNSKTFNDKTSTPTNVVLQDDSYKRNPEANNDAYYVVGPTAESSFKITPKTTTQGTENYMILDPNQTGFNRSRFPNADQAYELAKPIHDTKDQKSDLYALSPDGTYDHSGIARHNTHQDAIYTHAVDNVYDSASRGLNIARKEDTYDHFFGQETEDEYNISMH